MLTIKIFNNINLILSVKLIMEDINYIGFNEVSEIFKILSHPIRVRIVVSLANRPKNYTSLQFLEVCEVP
jgi:DNA-binding transcriptional ArsR family regulator